MSRFDLFFVVIDELNEVNDYNIARHITNIHRFQDAAVDPPYSMEQLQRCVFNRALLKCNTSPHTTDIERCSTVFMVQVHQICTHPYSKNHDTI